MATEDLFTVVAEGTATVDPAGDIRLAFTPAWRRVCASCGVPTELVVRGTGGRLRACAYHGGIERGEE